MKRLVICLLGIALAALGVAPTALAHKGGKAEPRISATASGTGYSRMVTVRLTDIDDRNPILGATVYVSGQMVKPHVMTLAPRPLSEISAGTYRGQRHVNYVVDACRHDHGDRRPVHPGAPAGISGRRAPAPSKRDGSPLR